MTAGRDKLGKLPDKRDRAHNRLNEIRRDAAPKLTG
jgi:hypothetical protein